MKSLNIPFKISIITTFFNQGEYIDQCILNVLDQNYSNLELPAKSLKNIFIFKGFYRNNLMDNEKTEIPSAEEIAAKLREEEANADKTAEILHSHTAE